MRRPGSPDWFENDITYDPFSEFDREAVRHAQRVLRVDETGCLDHPTRAALRGFQGIFRLPQNGALTLDTAIKIEQVRNRYA